MHEITGLFGSSRHLVGTLALPDSGQSARVGFILLNAGVIHRIGPHRINVKLAHALAREGVPSLRFDLSGQGDSHSVSTGCTFDQQAVRDLRSAMDHMERTVGVREFVIAGICSGAHHGVAAARDDTRVTGLWLFDGYVYPTAKTRRARYQHELEQEGAAAFMARAWRRLTGKSRPEVTAENGFGPPAGGVFWPPAPPREVYAATLQKLLDRSVRIFMVHSGGFIDEYSYADQFKDGFSELLPVDEIRCDFRPEVDHTITSVAAQRVITKTIGEWFRGMQADGMG